MWPFTKKRKSDADLTIEWMPRAIEVAGTKWNEFRAFPAISQSPLEMQIFAFQTMLEKGLREWEAFRRAPEPLILLVAALGIEYSGTHSRSEIEKCLGLTLPSNPLLDDPNNNFEDSKFSAELIDELVARARSKWLDFNQTLKFKEGVPLSVIAQGFLMPFSEHVRNFIGSRDVPDDFIRRIVVIGIADSGTHSLQEAAEALGIRE